MSGRDLLARVPPAGGASPRGLGASQADEAHELMRRLEQAVEAEPRFTDAAPLGVVLTETRIPTLYSGSLVHIHEIQPGTQAAGVSELRKDQLLVRVNGDSILNLPYEMVLELVKKRPVQLTFASSPHLDDDAGPYVASPDVRGASRGAAAAAADEYSVRIHNSGSFGFNLQEVEDGDVVVEGFSNVKPEAAGVQPGSVLLWVEGHDVRGQGTDGVQRAIGLCRSAHTVEFVFRKPAVAPAAHLQPVLVPFDCTFEERDPLGLEFRPVAGEPGGVEELVVSNVAPGSQAALKFPYVREEMQLQKVNGHGISGVGLDEVRRMCVGRPVTLTIVDPHHAGAIGLPGPAVEGAAHGGAVPETSTILDRVDRLLSTPQAPAGPDTGRSVDAPWHEAAPLLSSPLLSSPLSPATGPERERRLSRRQSANDSEPLAAGGRQRAYVRDEHDDLLDRIDQIRLRQVYRSSGSPRQAASEPSRSSRPHRRAGWGARVAAGDEVVAGAGAGGGGAASATEIDIAARRRAREQRRAQRSRR